MLQLKNMFRGVKTLLSRYNKARKQQTKDKYYEEIRTKLDNQHVDKVFKEDIQRQKQGENQRKQMEKRLKAALKQQRKLEKERVRQDAKMKKLRKQQELSSRLLFKEERNLLLRRKYNQALDQGKLNKINKKLRDDKLEQIRRKKLANKHGKVSDKIKKLNEKFNQLNDFVGNVKIEQSEKTLASGKIVVYRIMPEKLRKVEFLYFLEAVKPASISALKGNRGSKKGHLKIKFTMVKRNPRTDEVEDRAEMHCRVIEVPSVFPCD